MKTCKKLFSLLLVAVMLVAAIPFAAMATPIGHDVDGPFHVVAKCNDVTIKENTWEGQFVSAFEPDTKNGAEMVLDGAPNTTYYTFKDTNFDEANKTLTVNYTLNTHTHDATNTVVTGKGDANGHTVKCTIAGCTYAGVVGHVASGEATKAIPAVAATCGQDGHEAATEYACGYTVGGAVIPATGAHNFQNGTCTVCGATDPNWKGTTGGGSGSTGGNTGSTTTKKTVVVTVDGVSKTYTEVNYNGSVTPSATDVQAILSAVVATGANPNISLSSYNITSAELNNNTITIVLATKAYEGYTLNLTVNGSNNTSTVTTYMGVNSYSGDTSDVANVLKTFKVTSYDLKNYNVTKNEYVANTKTFNIGLTAKPTDADKYTVICNVNGNQLSSKTNVAYVGSLESNAANAQAILTAANITTSKAVDQYKNISISKSSNGVITVDLRDTASIKVYNNANTYTTVTMEVGRPYVNYLGTNIINNSTFGGITVKDNSGASRFYTASQVTGGTAVVNANDVEVTIQRNGDSCTLNFLRSDGTVLESRKLYAGDQIGTLPSYTVGGVPATWTYNGKPISATDVYNFKTTSVNIVPYFGGISDVYVDVYINGNVKTMQTRVKVTDLVQNGVLYLNTDVKGAIASALRNTSNKNLTYTAFFDASTWSDFIKTKNTSGAAEPYRVGDNSERQGAVYLYVMVNNATVKATDSTNPKTGDNVKLGVAAAILAVAVVGFGAVVVINKKKGVR